ncbi:G-type lectin S-receptor-like serine/threonine-protein kinase At2g19130 [Hordeum vulgare subsp. vulgare]|uniref:G-type lectin S-receptor-like serine/threonine-protein kinase At2g19130 n=1 Tax=Hordeum vulgare subsp. vulgare TaxID=112509 RepID=UPI001D1A459C|nr:G-type lectin S-receptor-like serine/threonine-protein kinase At2g19130 [Hordeum vulgare subsp. vulgare]
MPPLYILLGLLLLHTPAWCSSAAATEDTLTVGQSLGVGDKLVSRNGKFALGFFHPAASSISKSSRNATSPTFSWYLGIWFNKIPVFTTVWVANREEPITHHNLNLTQLKISSDGNLVIVNHVAKTQSIVWSTHIVKRNSSSINTTTSITVVLLNSGNLALLANSPDMLWQSFDYPTDVALPGAKLGRNKVPGFIRQYISKKSLIDQGLGSYSIELNSAGIVLKHRNPSVVYWLWTSSRTSSLNLVQLIKTTLDLDPGTRGNKFKRYGFSIYHNPGSAGGIVAFRYTDLVRATKSFSEKLGGGGFGSVYKGMLSDSATTIAVKRLDGARQGEKQFRAEVSSIGLIQHINLVKLIGFCCEGDHRLLVYEHMLSGSLNGHLFKKSNTNVVVLNWNIRYQISIGVARGLSYLHQGCRECIIHCDIKPENILLDALFVPKVADFGLAAFVGRDFSRILTSFRGTAGYLAPEWLTGVAITPKVDVYSFGMVLLEIISGRRNSSSETSYNTSSSNSNQDIEYFPVEAISKLHGGDLKSLVDPQLHGDFNLEEIERVCKVACWCIQDNELDRPTMGEVVRVLEGQQDIVVPPMPRLLAAITEQSGAATSV